MTPQEFLEQMADTANRLDFEAHMNLISKDVSVFGLPGIQVVKYDGWHDQCEYEFENKVLKRVSYEGMHILSESQECISFRSVETVEGTDGNVNTNFIEFVINKEEDGQWRVTQERVLSAIDLAMAQQNGTLQ